MARLPATLRLAVEARVCSQWGFLKAKVGGDDGQSPIKRPKLLACQASRCQKVDVDPADAAAVQLFRIDEIERLVMIGYRCRGEALQQRQQFFPVAQVSAGELTNDEGVHQHCSKIQRLGQAGVALSEVVDPNRRVGDHAVRRRRGARKSGSVPPRAAKRRAFA